MDEETIASVLRISYDSLHSFYVLLLLFSNFNFEFKNPNLDHLHPRSSFNQDTYATSGEDELEYYQQYWNTVLNLAILYEEQNKSKNRSALKPWIEGQEKRLIKELEINCIFLKTLIWIGVISRSLLRKGKRYLLD